MYAVEMIVRPPDDLWHCYSNVAYFSIRLKADGWNPNVCKNVWEPAGINNNTKWQPPIKEEALFMLSARLKQTSANRLRKLSGPAAAASPADHFVRIVTGYRRFPTACRKEAGAPSPRLPGGPYRSRLDPRPGPAHC